MRYLRLQNWHKSRQWRASWNRVNIKQAVVIRSSLTFLHHIDITPNRIPRPIGSSNL